MKVIGILLVILAVIVGILPLFTDCESQGRALTLANGKEVAMKCHWSGRAELVLAIPLLAIGVFAIFSKSAESLRNLSLISVLMGVLIILVPTTLIGVCGSAEMICNSIMKPTLILLGSLVIALGAAGVVMSMTKRQVAA